MISTTNTYLFIGVCLALLASFIPERLAAQANDTTQTILPDLSPREVEIRGQLEISFPSLRRQPLIGFNPPPRVPELPENYRPFIEDYKLSGTDIPTNQAGQFDPPEVLPLGSVNPTVGELETSAGRYLARHVRARLSTALTPNAALYGNVDYEGSEGYTPDDNEDDLRNPYDGLRATLGFQSVSPRVGLGVELKGGFNSYTLFGTNFLQSGALSSSIVLPDRNGLFGNADFWVRSYNQSSMDSEFRIGFSSSRYQTDVFDSALNALPRLNQQEQRLHGLFDIDVPFSLGSFLVSTNFSTSGIDLSTPTAGIDDFGLFEFKNYYVSAGSGFRLDFTRSLSVTLAGRYLGTSFVENGTVQNRSFMTAEAGIDLYPSSGLTFFLHNKPGIDRNSMWDVFEKSPYVIDQPTLQSTLRPIDAEAGFSFFKGVLNLSAKVGFIQTPNYIFFEAIPEEPITGYDYRRGVFSVNYDDAEVYHADGAVSLSLSSGLHLKFGLSVREAELTDNNEEIPYFSPFLSENMVSYAFANDQMLVQVIGTFHSSRYTSRDATEEIPGYIDMDFLYTYMLHSGLGLVVRMDNILGDSVEYWEHYSESPFTLSAGLRVLW